METKRVVLVQNKEKEEFEKNKRKVDRKRNQIDLVLIIVFFIIATVLLTYICLNSKNLSHNESGILSIIGGFSVGIVCTRVIDIWIYL